MSTNSLFGARRLLQPHLITTANQKILSLLAKFSDLEFYEREIVRRLEISTGSANRALNELYSSGVIKRRREGKMLFYSIILNNATTVELKKLVNLLLIEPLIQKLKLISTQMVLYGSCAQGTDNSESDLDLFIVSHDKHNVLDIIHNFKFPRGYENIHIQPVVKTLVELLNATEAERTFLEEVEGGIKLWDKVANESRV